MMFRIKAISHQATCLLKPLFAPKNLYSPYLQLRCASGPSNRPFTKDEDDHILRLRAQGVTFNKIAATLGRSGPGVSRRYHVFNDQTRRFTHRERSSKSRLTAEEDEHIIRRLLEKGTFDEIALEQRRPRQTIELRYATKRLFKLNPALPLPVIKNFDSDVGHEAAAMWEKGMFKKEIREQLQLSHHGLNKYLAVFEARRQGHRPWSVEERQQLVHLKSTGWTFPQIAAKLKRKFQSVTSQYQAMRRMQRGRNIPSPLKEEGQRQVRRRWTTEDLKTLARMHKAGFPVSTIAASLGRTEMAVNVKLNFMRHDPYPESDKTPETALDEPAVDEEKVAEKSESPQS